MDNRHFSYITKLEEEEAKKKKKHEPSFRQGSQGPKTWGQL
jgi:hypothetical protein